MGNRPLALASGVLPEASPVQLVEATAAAGFDLGGMWIEAAEWTGETTRAVQRALRDTGLRLLDIEVLWIRPGPPDPDHLRIVEVGAELGARNVLCVSSDPDRNATIDKLAIVTERAATLDIRLNLEFGPFTEVRTLHDAASALAAIDSPAKGLLIDALHWTRSGGTPADIAALPRALLSYAQLCDGPRMGAPIDDLDAYIAEAVDDRLPLGHGAFALDALLATLPDGLPVSIEERSRPLRETYPDFTERARAVARTSRAFLASRGMA